MWRSTCIPPGVSSLAIAAPAERAPGEERAVRQPDGSRNGASQSGFKRILGELPGDDDSAPEPVSDKKTEKDDKNEAPIVVPIVDIPNRRLPLGFVPQQTSAELPAPAGAMNATEELQASASPQQDTDAQAPELAFAAKVMPPEVAPAESTLTPAVPPPSSRPQSGADTPGIARPLHVPALPQRSVSPLDTKTEHSPETPRLASHGSHAAPTLNEPVHSAPQSVTTPVLTANPPFVSSAARTIGPVPSAPATQLQTVEHAALMPQADAAKAPAMNELSVRIAGPDQTSAAIRIVDHSGELRVAIRASDVQLASSLRGNVEQLTSRLNATGFSAEIWKPESIAPASRIQSSGSETNEQRHSGSQQQFKSASDRDQQNPKQKRPDWTEEFDLWK